MIHEGRERVQQDILKVFNRRQRGKDDKVGQPVCQIFLVGFRCGAVQRGEGGKSGED